MIKYLFINHRTKKIISGEGVNFPDPKKGCIWLYLSKPSDEEKNKISRVFEIDPAYLKNYTREIRSKRYSTRPLVFVMVDYFCENGAGVKKTNILTVLQKDLFITMVPETYDQYNKIFEDILEYLNEQTKSNRNIGEILYEFLDRDVQDNYEVLRLTEERIAVIEKKILIREAHELNDILSLKKELFAMSRRFWATSKIVFLIRKGLIGIDIAKKTEALLLDVYDAFQHQIQILETQREMLSDSITLYETSLSNKLALISNDLNIVMKKLTSFTVILLIPSLIAGIYGMNFNYLPRADSITGFFEITGMMIVLGGLMYLLFHKMKWI